MRRFIQFIELVRIDTMTFEAYKKNIKLRQEEIRCLNDVIQKGSWCRICGSYYDPGIIEFFIFEDHHISGRRNSSTVIRVCPNCHKLLSLNQRGWDPRWMDANNSDLLKLAFHLRGISDISALNYRLSKDWYNQILRGDLT